MSLTVRLQGLPPIADSISIFFTGLKIPCGGVNIIGGVHGEASFKFKNSHYVCLALKRSGQVPMDSPIYISVEKLQLQQNPNRHVTRSQHNPGYLLISFRPLDAKLSQLKSFFQRIVCEKLILNVNVSLCAEKSHIRKVLHNLVGGSQITFLYDKNGNRQQECFVMFITENDYVLALELDKAVLKGRRLRVLSISNADMIDLIESKREVVLGDPVLDEEVMEPDVKYLYLRNFAACVNKLEVLNFFTGFSLTEKDICLSYDDNGDCQ